MDDVQLLQAAVLHDTIKDINTTYEELVARFGKGVADIVAEITVRQCMTSGLFRCATVRPAAPDPPSCFALRA